MNPDAQNPNPNDAQPGVTTPEAATTPPAPEAATPPATPTVPEAPVTPSEPTPPSPPAAPSPSDMPSQVASPDATGKKPMNKLVMIGGAIVLVFVALIAVLALTQ